MHTKITAAFCSSLFVVSVVHADEDSHFTVGASVFGMAAGNFLAEPANDTLTLSNGVSAEAGTYPGFAGVGAGFGFGADVRYRSFVGLEVNLVRSTDRGKGDIGSATVEIGETAWHVPLFIKAMLPTPVMEPSVFVGPEFVFPGDAEATVTPSQPKGTTQLSASAERYTMLTFGFGFEFKLPLPIDLRIPLTLRGSINPSTADTLDERATHEISGTTVMSVDYVSEWQYRVAATLGVMARY